jgi:hypothetical protein
MAATPRLIASNAEGERAETGLAGLFSDCGAEKSLGLESSDVEQPVRLTIRPVKTAKRANCVKTYGLRGTLILQVGRLENVVSVIVAIYVRIVKIFSASPGIRQDEIAF